MIMDPFGLGRIVQDGLVFRQNFSIRSYEIGADRSASIETVMNHLQVLIMIMIVVACCYWTNLNMYCSYGCDRKRHSTMLRLLDCLEMGLVLLLRWLRRT